MSQDLKPCQWRCDTAGTSLCLHPESTSADGKRCWCIEVTNPDVTCIGREKPKRCPICGESYWKGKGCHPDPVPWIKGSLGD